jgi:hypothetical protein
VPFSLAREMGQGELKNGFSSSHIRINWARGVAREFSSFVATALGRNPG